MAACHASRPSSLPVQPSCLLWSTRCWPGTGSHRPAGIWLLELGRTAGSGQGGGACDALAPCPGLAVALAGAEVPPGGGTVRCGPWPQHFRGAEAGRRVYSAELRVLPCFPNPARMSVRVHSWFYPPSCKLVIGGLGLTFFQPDFLLSVGLPCGWQSDTFAVEE